MRRVRLAASCGLLVLVVLAAAYAGMMDHGDGDPDGPPLLDQFERILVPRAGQADGGEIFRYKHGNGPGVLILHEVYGLTHETLQLAKDIGDQGYSVFVPLLFGKPEKKGGGMLSVCRSEDFYCLPKHRSSPIVTWLRGLLPEVKERSGSQGVAVIGMCLTGSFPIAFLDDPDVKVIVLSQPSLPLSLTPAHKRAFGLNPGVIDAAVKRMKESPVRILAFRYEHDKISPAARLKAVKDVFGVEGIEYPESLYKGKEEHPHALLTNSRLEEAFQEVVKALDEELKPR